MSVVREITTSSRLIEEGSTPDGLFVVESGSITVCTQQADRKSMTLANLEAGSLVGEMSWLEGRPAVASIDAAAGSRLLQIPIAALVKAQWQSYLRVYICLPQEQSFTTVYR
ncbi:MAG: cyclic nucleotide-binding domain-containing protein [Prochlorococcus sp.]